MFKPTEPHRPWSSGFIYISSSIIHTPLLGQPQTQHQILDTQYLLTNRWSVRLSVESRGGGGGGGVVRKVGPSVLLPFRYLSFWLITRNNRNPLFFLLLWLVFQVFVNWIIKQRVAQTWTS
ncbi:hypothetical protein niasHT_002536 [Heterodera trifolii]|uniref:Uncharacterized protein n=1 Tax=Heterodera trifolii TaxID=157864 RepID=A0ABD2LNB3_9BILA